MIELDTSEIRAFNKLIAPSADFDSVFSFYYDETNNLKKFYVRENDFNSSFTANFILGGLVHLGPAPDVQPLIDSFNLQKTAKEVKFKHIANGTFLDCLKSNKLKLFFEFIEQSDLYVHYSSLNILYWSLVDIVDSAIASSEVALNLGPQFANHLKNDLYKLARLEIDAVIELFDNFGYPNIQAESLLQFIEELTSLFHGYIDTEEYHFGLESLRQILKEARNKGSLPFIMDEEDHILLKDLSQFYLRPVYTFKNSTHIFDNEDDIAAVFQGYKLLDGSEEITSYTFVNSPANTLIQLSDIFVGIMGKMSQYLNTSSRENIVADLASLSEIQSQNMELLTNLIDRSHSKNIGFIYNTNSYEELSKLELLSP